MRILHISAYALRGGCEKNCFHFIDGSRQDLHSIIVLNGEGPMSEEWRGLGVTVKHLDILTKGLLAFSSGLFRATDGSKYDLVICWSTIRLPLQLHALKSVASKVKVYLGNPVGKGYRYLKDVVLSALYPPPKDVTLMACSEYTARSYRVNKYYRRFPVRVSLNPVDIPSLIPLRSSGSAFALGMVARLDPIKDHATVISAFAQCHDRMPGAILYFAGDGILALELKDLVKQEGIESYVVFHGDVANVNQLLASWNMFVYATTPSEGLGSAVAEAMASGLPCVLSDLPMLRELAPADGLVKWFEPGNPGQMAARILEIFSNPGLATSLGIAAHEHASRNFGVNRFIKDYCDE